QHRNSEIIHRRAQKGLPVWSNSQFHCVPDYKKFLEEGDSNLETMSCHSGSKRRGLPSSRTAALTTEDKYDATVAESSASRSVGSIVETGGSQSSSPCPNK